MTISNLELHGIDKPLEEEILLRAGPFEAVFEPSRGYLRSVRLNGVTVVRNVYVHVRAPEWETIVPIVTMLEKKVGANHFLLTWKGVHHKGDVDFEWLGTLSGTASEVFYGCDGVALRTFKTNRTSLCVLLPREFKGLTADIERSDGTRTAVQLPDTISPQQPLKAMHVVTVGPVRLTFQGADFDAEDQRNWTDASFKAYPTGSRQYVEGLKKSERIVQSVRIEPSGRSGAGLPAALVGGTKPLLGANVVNDRDDLGGLHVDFLRLELPQSRELARSILDHARSLNLPLHVIAANASDVPKLGPHETLTASASKQRPEGSERVYLGAGSFDSFNMGRHEAKGFDGVEITGTPQIHTFDERSILDNAATLGDVIASLKQIQAGRIALAMTMGSHGPDPRLTSLFGALWVLRSYAAAWDNDCELSLGTTEEMRYPAIAALLMDFRAEILQPMPVGNLSNDVVVLGGTPTLVGNLSRQPRPLTFKGKTPSGHTLRAGGWEPRKFKEIDALRPYEIVRLLQTNPDGLGLQFN